MLYCTVMILKKATHQFTSYIVLFMIFISIPGFGWLLDRDNRRPEGFIRVRISEGIPRLLPGKHFQLSPTMELFAGIVLEND